MQIDTNVLLNTCSQYLIQHNALIHKQVQHHDITINSTEICLFGHRSKTIVFCQGFQAESNPFFTHLDFQNCFGDVITFESNQLANDQIAIHQKWCCPTTANQFKFGATAYWDNLRPIQSLNSKNDYSNSSTNT